MPVETAREHAANIAWRLFALSRELPDKRAVAFATSRRYRSRRVYATITFGELERASAFYAEILRAGGFRPGMRTLLLVKPGVEFIALTFALFRLGAVPVLIDPGMGKESFLDCVARVEPEGMVAVPTACFARLLYPRFFKSVTHLATLGRRWLWGGCRLPFLRLRLETAPSAGEGETRLSAAESAADEAPIYNSSAEELAAILFTSGATGPAKGVEYEHRIFATQLAMLASHFGVSRDDVDLATFPLFALLSIGLGMTAVMPHMDFSRPAAAEPMAIVEAIADWRCTFSFGSPALWGKVAVWCNEKEIVLPSLRKVLMAGAPVMPIIHERLRRILPQGTAHTPYGATECLPVADIQSAEVLAETAAVTKDGGGICVGRPLPGVEVAIIRITEEEIASWNSLATLPPGTVGEITVKGPTVTRRYFRDERATRLAKISCGDACWHRMGDLGYLDSRGRLWFCGRKSHRVETSRGMLYPICCEALFLRHPEVKRAALVGIGPRPRQVPAIVVEPVRMPASPAEEEILREALLAIASRHPLTMAIRDILFHPAFPVDSRHNAKIKREELSKWAAEIMAKYSSP